MSVEGGTKLLHKQIRTPGTATSNVPLSQAIKVGPTLYISGNLGLDMQTRKFVGPDIESQTRQTLLNMQAVLKEAGMTFKNVVKTTVLLADINDFARANAVYSTYGSWETGAYVVPYVVKREDSPSKGRTNKQKCQTPSYPEGSKKWLTTLVQPNRTSIIWCSSSHSHESRTEIKTTGASSPIGPYSQALKVGSTLYISGSVGVDPSTKKFAGADIESQTVRTLKNIEAILEEAGMSLQNVVKTTILLADIREFSKMNAEYAKFFKAPYPARAAYQVANLPESARVEIEAIAVE